MVNNGYDLEIDVYVGKNTMFHQTYLYVIHSMDNHLLNLEETMFR